MQIDWTVPSPKPDLPPPIARTYEPEREIAVAWRDGEPVLGSAPRTDPIEDDEDLKLWRSAAHRDSAAAGPWIALGDALQRRGRHADALDAYTHAASVTPAVADAAFKQGLMLQTLGRPRDAARSYLRALAVDPKHFEANHNLAIVYLTLGRGGDAAVYAGKATELEPSSAASWINLGIAEAMESRHEKAITAYERARLLTDFPAPMLVNLAQSQLAIRRYEDALITLHAAELREKSAMVIERQGYALFKLHRIEEALATYRRAMDLAPNDTQSINGAALCLMTQYLASPSEFPGKRERAIQYMRRSLEIKPDQPYITDILTRLERM